MKDLKVIEKNITLKAKDIDGRLMFGVDNLSDHDFDKLIELYEQQHNWLVGFKLLKRFRQVFLQNRELLRTDREMMMLNINLLLSEIKNVTDGTDQSSKRRQSRKDSSGIDEEQQ